MHLIYEALDRSRIADVRSGELPPDADYLAAFKKVFEFGLRLGVYFPERMAKTRKELQEHMSKMAMKASSGGEEFRFIESALADYERNFGPLVG